MAGQVFRIGILVQFAGALLLSSFARADQFIGEGLPPKYWAVSTSIAHTRSLYVTQDGNEASSVDFAFAPSIILNADYTVSALIESSQDLKAEDYDFGRGLVSLKKSSGLSVFLRRVKVTPSLTLGLPISRAQKAASLNVSTTGGLRADANSEFLFSKKLSLAASLSLTRNFHEYDTAYDGKVNTKYSSLQSLEAGWAFNDRWSLTLNLGHYDALSYQGAARDFLSHSQEIGLQMTPRLSLAAGHAWGAPYVATRKDNQDFNFELVDDRNSLVYFQMGFLL